ncbi:MAG: hypothetical protein ACK4TB_11960 [Gemmobacter sp.]
MNQHAPDPTSPLRDAAGTPRPAPPGALSQNAVLVANRMLAGLEDRDVLMICGLSDHRGVEALALTAMRAAAALSGRRVLLVDALAPHGGAGTTGPGFTDLLDGAPVAPGMVRDAGGGLRRMGVGTRPALAAPGALMVGAVAAAVAALRAEADLTCLVAAPLMRSVGTAGLAKHARATVLCVHRGVDRRDTLARAVEDLAATGTRLIGTVFLR